MRLDKDSAYRISYKTRDGLLRSFEGQFRGKQPLYTEPGHAMGLRFDTLRPDEPVAYVIPEPLVHSIEELWAEVHGGNGGKRLIWKDSRDHWTKR